MGLILTIIAYFLLCIFIIPAITIGTIVSLFNHTANKYFKDIALSLDQLGNVICQHLFNICLIKKTGYKFGNPDETISSVLGKNYVNKTLTKVGYLLSLMLHKVDKNHVINSIDNTENE